MREILFRGKDIENGKWVEGFYIAEDYNQFTRRIEHIPQIQERGNILSVFIVNPSTVGQYTGLTDKNGKKIFEGDILRGQYDEDNPEDYTFLEVVWNNGWRITPGRGNYDFLEEFDCQRCEVIGNIYDNPSCWKA